MGALREQVRFGMELGDNPSSPKPGSLDPWEGEARSHYYLGGAIN